VSAVTYLEMFLTSLAATYEVRVVSFDARQLPATNAYEVVGWLERDLPSGNILSGPLRCRVPTVSVMARHTDGVGGIAAAIADGGLRQLVRAVMQSQ
jgi:hypothetical protein